jgi:glucose-1-phosphate thymidylyltransferase
MKGVVLAGGLGTRLHPLTKITNKHLLPVYSKPMVFYPIELLANAGITEMVLVTGGNNPGDFLRLMGNGKELGMNNISYVYQEGEGGIAEALGLAEFYVRGDDIAVVLGDNIFENDITDFVDSYRQQGKGAKILLKEVPDPHRFGVATVDGDRVVRIDEKPKDPATNFAVVGVYMYDSSVFDIIRTLKPSNRGELEITDVNNAYIERGEMTFDIVKGWWTDAGTFPSLYRASRLVAEKEDPTLKNILPD